MNASSPFAQSLAPLPAEPTAMPAFQGIPPAVASFEVPHRPVVAEHPKLGNLPFSAQATPSQPSASPFLSVPSGVAPQRLAAAASSETMEVSLAAVLRGQSTPDLGFDPNFIPAWITTKLPAADVRQQLGSGEVVLDLGTIIDGTDSSFRSVISHGRRGFQVRIASSEIFQNMPPAASQPAAPQAPAPAAASPFLAPAAQAPEQPSFQSPFLPPSAPAPAPTYQASPAHPPASDWGNTPAAPPAPAPFTPPANAGGFSADQLFASQPAEPAPFVPGTAKRASTTPLMSGFGPATPTPADPRQIKAVPSFFADPAPAAPAAFEPAPAPAFQPMPVRDQVRTPSVSLRPPTGPLLPAVRPSAPAPSSANGALGISTGPDGEQMLLRALLGVSEKLSAERVVEMTSRLHGVCACALVRGLKTINHGDGSQAAHDFTTKAAEIANSIQTIAGLTGIAAETLNITTGDRLITFCFQNGLTLGVLHTDREPPSGLREKITLLSRELAAMPSALV